MQSVGQWRYRLTLAGMYSTINPDGLMNKTAIQQQPGSLLAWMECLSDPTRLRLMRLLERHELGVVELCDVLQMPQSTVSRHLKVLADQAFVQSRREGTTHLYRTILEELDPVARRLWSLTREQTENWPAVRQDEMRLARRLRQRESESQTFFAGAARQWDELRAQLYGQGFVMAALLSLLPNESVIADLGCGTGQMTALLAPHVSKVIAVDNSPAMLKAAQKQTAGFENVELHKADLRALPVESGGCDGAMIVLVLSYLPEPLGVLKEAARILNAGGKLVVVDLMPHDREDFRRQMGQQHLGFSSEMMREMLSGAGFEKVEISPIAPEAGTKGPGLFLAIGVKAISE